MTRFKKTAEEVINSKFLTWAKLEAVWDMSCINKSEEKIYLRVSRAI